MKRKEGEAKYESRQRQWVTGHCQFWFDALSSVIVIMPESEFSLYCDYSGFSAGLSAPRFLPELPDFVFISSAVISAHPPWASAFLVLESEAFPADFVLYLHGDALRMPLS